MAVVFLYQAFVIPFEISALAIVLSFWSDDIPIWAVCLVVIILYAYVWPSHSSRDQAH